MKGSVKQNLPPSAAFGDNSVYVGEYGVPENEFTEEQIKKVLANNHYGKNEGYLYGSPCLFRES